MISRAVNGNNDFIHEGKPGNGHNSKDLIHEEHPSANSGQAKVTKEYC